MRTDKLTTKFQQALQDAQSLALQNDKQQLEPVHLLCAMLDPEGGSTRSVLAKAGVMTDRLRSACGREIDKLPQVSGGEAGEVYVSRNLSNLLNAADKTASKRGDSYIATEHFLLALPDDKGPAGEALRDAGGDKRTDSRWSGSDRSREPRRPHIGESTLERVCGHLSHLPRDRTGYCHVVWVTR